MAKTVSIDHVQENLVTVLVKIHSDPDISEEEYGHFILAFCAAAEGTLLGALLRDFYQRFQEEA
jgi:hypothetical protein